MGPIAAFKSVFQTVVVFCSALNRFGNALDHVGRYTEASAAAFADEADEERSDKRAARAAKRALIQQGHPVEQPQLTNGAATTTVQ